MAVSTANLQETQALKCNVGGDIVCSVNILDVYLKWND